MNREIKFRAFDMVNKVMYGAGTIIGLEGETSKNYHARNPNCYLSQYTGLVDIIDTEIYEGDVLELANARYVVSYDLYTTAFKATSIKSGFLISRDWSSAEVIGNIYQNPELLGS